MARAPNQKAEQAKAMYLSGMKLVEIANQLQLSEGTVRSWKNRGRWGCDRNAALQRNECNVAKKRGGKKGNKNAVNNNGGAPIKNSNAEKHGLFRKWLPEEAVSIIEEMPCDPLNILWDQIQIAYAAIVRAQKIMYVRDQEDKTVERIGESSGDTSSSEKWEVQQAWDKQATFLQAQARAQKTLEGMLKQYDELLHKRGDLATEEQRARIDKLRAETVKLQEAKNDDSEGQLEELIRGLQDA